MQRPLGIYIHWPFCRSKCPYCDFNSHVFQNFDEATWAKGICDQLTEAHAFYPAGHGLESVFFGGGTPSLLTPAVVEKILHHIDKLWGLASSVEVSLEANPTSLELANIPGYRSAGVNRLSVGVQSLRDADLHFLGRQHSRLEALHALKALPQHFQNYSFDLIYARPQQTLAAWRTELEEALSYVGPHLSVYQLTIEPGTAFYTRFMRGDFSLPSEDVAVEMYDLTQELLTCAGLQAYEVSNHAQSGFACRHNLIYWRYEDYIGVGPGAHGRIWKDGHKWATIQEKAPAAWQSRIQHEDAAPSSRIKLEPQEMIEEYLFMGLRIRDGISRQHFFALTSLPLESVLPPTKLNALQAEGLLEDDGECIRPTLHGLKMVNSIWHFLKPSLPLSKKSELSEHMVSSYDSQGRMLHD